ncbi:hypothetical protein CEXT_411571 [Caerostris extrusa]|uniref:Uncharacterized protein n=1 Tax=Caerostris extrusa TaxID=172846 RepID=A0AAV4NTM1_CAEEX|nr:hypothetical protein CEXT_411571 [Caerostris extrusa]
MATPVCLAAVIDWNKKKSKKKEKKRTTDFLILLYRFIRLSSFSPETITSSRELYKYAKPELLHSWGRGEL